MLTNAISEAIFESSGFGTAAVALIYAFLARRAIGLTRKYPSRNTPVTQNQLFQDAFTAFFDVSGLSMGPLWLPVSPGLVSLVLSTLSKSMPSCRLLGIK